MRIILVGQAAFGKDCLEALLEQGENVVGVVTIPDEPGDKRPNPVKELAMEKNIPVLQPEGRSPHRLKHPSVLPWLKDLKPDLLALVFVTDFMPYEVIKQATLGGINYHPSLLPKYRGGSAINWAVIGGETETGVTIHFIDEGVDTGDIILQEKVTVEANDSVGFVYFKKLYPLGIRLVKDAVRLIREGKAPRIPQDHSQSSFQPVITENDVRINWERPAWEIHNLIRGANPAPGAHTTLRGEKIKLWESEMQEANPETPGEILSIVEGAGFQVASGDRALLITRVQKAGEGKTPAAEFMTSAKLQPGEKLS